MFSFIWEEPLDGNTNMQRDVELLQGAEEGRPGARVYCWDRAWVTLGTSQVAERDLLDSNLVPWVVRPTGGKAVLHGHDVTVGLAVPLAALGDAEKLSRSVKTVYRKLIVPVVEALNECGVPAALAEETRFSGSGPRTADCFAHVSPNDVVDRRTGVKVCGCALKLTNSAVLLQASLPAGAPLVDPRLLFAHPQAMTVSPWETASFAPALNEALKKIFKARVQSLDGF